MTQSDVAVIGGGAVGLSVAWKAAAAGLSVTLLDERPGRGASWAAAGMLAPVTEVHPGEEALLELNLESSRRWPRFAAELSAASGNEAGYRQCGTMLVSRNADDNAVLDELWLFQTQLGLTTERLTRRTMRSLEPRLAAGVRGGILVPGDHQVDNRALLGALVRACRNAGVRLVRSPARAIQVTGDRAGAVETGAGEKVGAGVIVLAAGCWSAAVEGIPPQAVPPVRPVKGQLLHLRSSDGRPPSERNIRGSDVYMVGRPDGRVVVGATVEEQGFDETVRAGAVYELLRAAYELVPGVVDLELTEVAVGFRPASPDNAPLIGPSTVDSLLVATGHYRNGVLLAPVTAEAVVEMIVSGRVPDGMARFSPTRFEAAGIESS
ncbi:glycine oxidase ThiO [soil metagenome]